MTGLDLTVLPCHPPGSWQRALACMAVGIEVPPAEASALAHWEKLPITERTKLIDRDRKATQAIVNAAVRVLGHDEVVGADKLTRRVTSHHGVPGYGRTLTLLKAIKPSVDGAPSASTARQGRLFKFYADDLGGRPGHFFTRSIAAYEVFAAKRKSQQRHDAAAMSRATLPGRVRDNHGRFIASPQPQGHQP